MKDQPDCPAPKTRWKFSVGLIGGAGLGIVFGGAVQNPGLGLIVGSGVGLMLGFAWYLNGRRNAG